jgi:uncharacterized protein YuzE
LKIERWDIEKNLDDFYQIAWHFTNLPENRMWIDYDKESDVLYLSFKRPQKASDSVMTENGVLLRYKDKDLVGITILDASKRKQV